MSIGFGFGAGRRRAVLSAGGTTMPPAAPSATITMPATLWAFGSSSTSGSQQAASAGGGTEDPLTNVMRAVNALPAASLAYTTVGGSQTARPVDYVLTGDNAGKFIRNRGLGGQTVGAGGTIVATMAAAAGGIGASDFLLLHQGDNGIAGGSANAVEVLAGGYAALRANAPGRPFVHTVNTQGGRGSAGALAGEPPGSFFALAKVATLRVENDLNPGKAYSFHEILVDRAVPADANDITDITQGMAPRSYMMNDGSHQIGKGYNLQSDACLTPLVDAWAGGTPFPIKQIVEAAASAVPAAGDVVGSIVAYGSGGSFALAASNTQTDYAVSAGGQVTRIGAVQPARDITWAAVKTSKAGRFDKVQPMIGVCERAGPGVSRMVEFDGHTIIGMPDSKLTNQAKFTMLLRLKATDQSVIQNVIGGSSQMLLRLLTGGTLDVVLRNPAAASIYSKTTAANFRTTDPARWVAICIDLTNPAAEVTQLITWVDPATATSDVALSATLTADATTAQTVRTNQPWAIGAASTSVAAASVFGKFCMGDLTIWQDYIDFAVLANRQAVSNADGSAKPAWVSGGGVTDGKAPAMRLAGNAGDFRQCRITGTLAPATPGAAGQYLACNVRPRSAGGVMGHLVTA